MQSHKFDLLARIHRHIGGLEIAEPRDGRRDSIHRHIGGLENIRHGIIDKINIHRHIGGLEISSVVRYH